MTIKTTYYDDLALVSVPTDSERFLLRIGDEDYVIRPKADGTFTVEGLVELDGSRERVVPVRFDNGVHIMKRGVA